MFRQLSVFISKEDIQLLQYNISKARFSFSFLSRLLIVMIFFANEFYAQIVDCLCNLMFWCGLYSLAITAQFP